MKLNGICITNGATNEYTLQFAVLGVCLSTIYTSKLYCRILHSEYLPSCCLCVYISLLYSSVKYLFAICFWCVVFHCLGQLSLAIPPWVGTVSNSESLDVNRHVTWCTSLVSVTGLAVQSGICLGAKESQNQRLPMGLIRLFKDSRIRWRMLTRT